MLSLIALSLSCNKTTIFENETDVNIDIDSRYILFDSGIQTRGELIQREYLDASFDVLGYQYPGLWDIAVAHATPNVFDSTPQRVNYNDEDGIYSYTPEKIWSGNTYSFFGYYPCGHSNIKLFDGEEIKIGVPYITYTLPTAVYTLPTAVNSNIGQNPRDLIDLMTGSVMNTRIEYSAEVRMDMRHRLSAVDIAIRNYYILTENDITSPVTIDITKLVFKPLVENTKAIIYLDGVTETTAAEGNQEKELTYTLVDNSVDNSAENKDWRYKTFTVGPNDSEKPLTYITSDIIHKNIEKVEEDEEDDHNATSMIFIPQKNPLKYKLYIEYNLKRADGTIIESGKKFPVSEQEDVIRYFDYPLVEGRRYNVEVTFTASAVSVNITTSDEWDDKDDVTLEFE